MRWFRSLLSLSLGAALLTGMIAAGAANARPHGPGCGVKASVDRLERRIERLELDDSARAAVYEVLDAARTQERALRVRMREAHDAMRALLDAEQPDPEAVLAQADVLGALRAEAHKRGVRTLLEVRSLLTPGQWAQLQREREHRRHRGDRTPRG